MKNPQLGLWVALLTTALTFSLASAAEDKVIYDFETEADLKAWSNIDLAALRDAEAKAAIEAIKTTATNPATIPAYKPPTNVVKEPNLKLELTSENAIHGKQALKVTFAGGRMPTIATKPTLDDWRSFNGLAADITAPRTCMVVFRVMSKNSKYGLGYNDGVSRWEYAARVEPGKNHVVAPKAPGEKWNAIRSFEIYVYNPREGESFTIDNITLLADAPQKTTPYHEPLPVPESKYKVLGTDLVVADVTELANKLKDKWTKPADNTIEQVEADIQADFEKLKKDHPKAVLVTLREGQKGYDPANPDKPFAGWQDAGTPSHLPMGLTLGNFTNSGKSLDIETCFRNRPGFLRVDLASIPKNANILSARLVITRGMVIGKGWESSPTMFVAEPCNRPWNEYEVNVFEYAKDKFWKEYAGANWGEDGDFDAVFLAHGPTGGKVSTWDFTHAVKYWLDGKHANNGFVLYGAKEYVDYLHINTREATTLSKRPALAIIYETPNP